MGARLDPAISQLLEERKLTRFRAGRGVILKELDGARYDLGKAHGSLKQGDFKWATIQAYYAKFHSARALLFSQGFRERSHMALLEAIEALFTKNGKLEREYFDDFRNVKDLRELVDYGIVYSKESARTLPLTAEKFLRKVETILEI